MAHVRQQLREAVLAAVTGLPTTGGNVYGYRVHPLKAELELPALVVSTPTDNALEPTIHSPAIVDRVVEVKIEGFAEALDDSIIDTLDEIAEEIESVLGSQILVSGRGIDLRYESTEVILEDGERRAGVVTLTYRARLFNGANEPGILS